MIEQIARLAQRQADLERRVAGMLRYGRVVAVDPARATVDLDVGEGLVVPRVPYAQQAGALAVHAPPSVGQQMTIQAPGGDLRQAVAQPMTWGGSNAAPGSSSDANVITFGSLRLTLGADALVIEAAGATLRIDGAGVTVTGGDVVAQGISLVAHQHPGVQRGPAKTDPPS